MKIRVIVDVEVETQTVQVACNAPDAITMDVLMTAWRSVLVKTIKADLDHEKRIIPGNGFAL